MYPWALYLAQLNVSKFGRERPKHIRSRWPYANGCNGKQTLFTFKTKVRLNCITILGVFVLTRCIISVYVAIGAISAPLSPIIQT